METVVVGNRKIGDGHPCLLSFEPGATHTGLDSAIALVEAVAAGGGEAVKFQTIDTDEIMSHEDVQIEYSTSSGKRSESVYDALKRRELSDDEWHKLQRRAQELGLLFISTPSGPRTLQLLVDMRVDAIKVAKADINNPFLIEDIAKTGFPVILDAREKFEDVEVGLRICEKHEQKNIIIMHCPSGYPAEHAGIHLKTIPFIKSIFDYPVAYSDHSMGDYMNYAALGFGANMIEKTITLDRNTDAVEHYMSLEPQDVASFVERVRSIEEAFGNPRVIFNSRVNPKHRRSVVAKDDIAVGEEITLDKLEFRRPGSYLPVDRANEVLGHITRRNITKGSFLQLADVE
jgi:N,N'-diacetyllegionaminate synthase